MNLDIYTHKMLIFSSYMLFVIPEIRFCDFTLVSVSYCFKLLLTHPHQETSFELIF